MVLGGDIEFTKRIGKELAKKINRSGELPEILFTAEAKSLPLTYEVAKNLGHKKIAVARKNEKAYMQEPIKTGTKSITTSRKQILVLDKENSKRIRGRKVCLFDDVVSTGGTMKSLEKLVQKAKGKVVCRAAVWLEGREYAGDLIYLGELPIFTLNT